MAKKYIALGIMVGIVLGSLGTYFSNYALNQIGIEEISLPSMKKEKQMQINSESPQASILTNELQYRIIEVKKTDFGINGEKPLEGGIFLVTKIEIENFGKHEIIVYGKNWFLKDQEDRIYTPKTFNATPEKNDNIFSIRIPPGFKIVHDVGFEVPLNLESSRELYVADSAFESEPIFLGII